MSEENGIEKIKNELIDEFLKNLKEIKKRVVFENSSSFVYFENTEKKWEARV